MVYIPIYDYRRVAESAHKSILSDAQISKQSKEAYKEFYAIHDVSEARRGIINKHLKPILQRADDIREDMHDRKKMEKIFAELKREKSPSYYATIVNVTKVFLKYLNDGEYPAGIKNIRNIAKKKQKRDLSRTDMWEWPDMIKAVGYTQSIQRKAIGTTLLDGGFRPGEFQDLNYGDIETKGIFMVAHVDGKTGKRAVILFRCVPFLQRWMQNHPTKNKEDPLWVIEEPAKSHGRRMPGNRYPYFAMRKVILNLAAKAEIGKPADFYNLRHSSCFIDKLENIPDEVAAKKHGHSITHYVETYGRLSTDDDISRIAKAAGMQKKKDEDKDVSIQCRICSTINEPGRDICENCSNPLTLKKALEIQTASKSEIDDVKTKLDWVLKRLKGHSVADDMFEVIDRPG